MINPQTSPSAASPSKGVSPPVVPVVDGSPDDPEVSELPELPELPELSTGPVVPPVVPVDVVAVGSPLPELELVDPLADVPVAPVVVVPGPLPAVVSVLVPQIGYWSLLIMFLSGVTQRLLRRLWR